jgi:3D (Asp-Asp-Asp) domain-containing protein
MISTPGTGAQSTIAYAIKANSFKDTLPIIPNDSIVLFKSVLFRVDIGITVTRGKAAVAGQTISFSVSGGPSHARMLSSTDINGKATLRLDTRISGANTITPQASEFAGSTFVVTIGEAWYEARFLITAYNCCDEDDFSGELVEAKNVGKRKKDFLYGGRGVCMQGTGLGSDGKYIALSNPRDIAWNPGYAGVSNPKDAVFVYSDGVDGAYSKVTQDSSIAIDPTILPPLHRVDIIGPRALGARRGDDTGGAIKGHHFDNYAGAGNAAMEAWSNAGGNIQQAKVKYLGA